MAIYAFLKLVVHNSMNNNYNIASFLMTYSMRHTEACNFSNTNPVFSEQLLVYIFGLFFQFSVNGNQTKKHIKY